MSGPITLLHSLHKWIQCKPQVEFHCVTQFVKRRGRRKVTKCTFVSDHFLDRAFFTACVLNSTPQNLPLFRSQWQVQADDNQHWKESSLTLQKSIRIEMLHSVCTTGAKIMCQKDTKICYCPEKRSNPEAFEMARQENRVRWNSEQNSQLPHVSTGILDLEIPFSKEFHSLQFPRKEILKV